MSLSKARQLARDLGTVGISSSGTSIHTSVATLNFVGAGNTFAVHNDQVDISIEGCLLYTCPSPRDATLSRMPSSA